MRRTGAPLVALVGTLLLLAACSSDGGSDKARGILFSADDGTVLHGRIYGASGAAVVLVHDYDASQVVWRDLARTLNDRGFLVLTYDMRGHGDSPGNKEIGISDSDVSAALRYLGSQQAFVIGEGLGGAAAIRVASREKVLGVVALSAPMSFRGFNVASDIPRVEVPKLFLAAEGDAQGADDARTMKARAKDPTDLALIKGNARGAAMLTGPDGPSVRDRVLQFLDKYRPK